MTETDDHLIRQLRDVSDRLAHARAGILTLDLDDLTDCIRTIDDAIVALCVVQPIVLTALTAAPAPRYPAGSQPAISRNVSANCDALHRLFSSVLAHGVSLLAARTTPRRRASTLKRRAIAAQSAPAQRPRALLRVTLPPERGYRAHRDAIPALATTKEPLPCASQIAATKAGTP